MRTQAWIRLSLIIAVIVFVSGCRKDKIELGDDPSRIFLWYGWGYSPIGNYTSVHAEFQLDSLSGRLASPREPWEVRFNGELLYGEYSTSKFLNLQGLVDSGTLVYTDATGANYRAIIHPLKAPRIPATFTSINRNSNFIFYWEGDSTGNDESMFFFAKNIDSINAAGNYCLEHSYGIPLDSDMLGFLTPGTNNTKATLILQRETDLPAAGPKGGRLVQLAQDEKVISVY